MNEARYCAHCAEDLAPEQDVCPMCDEPSTTRSDAEEAAYERFCEDFYGGSGPMTLDEQHRAAWLQKRELKR